MTRESGGSAGFNVAALAKLAEPAWIKAAPLVDVFLVLNVLHEWQSTTVTGVMLGAAVQRLVGCEVKPGGPYASGPNVVDPVANACIAVFVGWAGRPLPGLLEFLDAHYDVSVLTTAKAPFSGKKIALSPFAAGLLAAYSPRLAPALRHSEVIVGAARQVLDEAERLLDGLPEEVRRHSLELLRDFDHGDDRSEVRLLPAFFAKSLRHPIAGVDSEFCALMGAANVHTWLAYTIYDDFYDNEAKPHLLPSANVSMRLAERLYLGAAKNAQQRDFMCEVFNRVDAANAWEMTHRRFRVEDGQLFIKDLPDQANWEYIADRAYFHALGPMAVIAQSDVLPDDPRWQAVWQGFGHYLVARQCNDDLLDWRADLLAGQATPVILSLLRHLGLKEGAQALAGIMSPAAHVFWLNTLPEICEYARQQITLARQVFAESGMLKVDRQGRLHPGSFTQLLDFIEESLQESLAARQQSQEFLSAFK